MSDTEKLITDVKSDLYIFDSTTEANILSLITTIESQKETIDDQYMTISTANMWNSKLKDELDSLKAITELAVRGLKEAESDLRGLHTEIGRNTKLNPATRDEYQAEISYIGQSIILQTLSEIARLSK